MIHLISACGNFGPTVITFNAMISACENALLDDLKNDKRRRGHKKEESRGEMEDVFFNSVRSKRRLLAVVSYMHGTRYLQP